MRYNFKGSVTMILSLAMVLMLGVPTLASQSYQAVTVPVGTVIPLRMDTYLSSDSSRVGDRFTATVFRRVEVNGWVAVPQGAKIEGHVTGVTESDRISKPGTLAIAFDRLVLPNGNAISVDGSLTSLDEEARRKLENIDEEDRVGGGDRTRRAVVFIGGGAGAGAIIGAVAGGGKGAAVGAGIGAVLGTIGVLLSKGGKAEVETGTEFGMMVERSFNTNVYDRSDMGTSPDQGFFTSTDSIQSTQLVLRDRGYYNGPINGVMNPQTREALRRFQRDRNLRISGDIDLSTAQALGIVSSSGYETRLVEIFNPSAQRIDRDSIRVSVDARTRSGGWQVFADNFVSGNTLHVYVRGVPPSGVSTSAITSYPVTQTINNVPNVTQAIFHGAERDITVDVTASGSTGGGSGSEVGNARQIAFLANRLLLDYQRDLNVRSNRGQVIFDSRRNLRENEVELLFQLNSLQAAAELYDQMITRVSDQDAIRGAADSLLRHARWVNRLLRRNDVRLSSIAQTDWDQFRTELARINVVNNNLDIDADRNR